MPGKIVEISCGSGYIDTVVSMAENNQLRVLSLSKDDENGDKASIRLYVESAKLQTVLDKLQNFLPPDSSPLIILSPVDAQIGGAESLVPTDLDLVVVTREEIFHEISKGTECDRNFLVLAVLATIVAAIGISEDNVAVVIGAMVIAPLLGPNLGLALGSVLGDRELIKDALFTNVIGLSITVLVAIIFSLVWAPNLQSNELLSRTQIQPAAIVLALASGIAAVVSLTTRLANTLVGVMVAVALAPPATVMGMMIGTQNWALASGAASLLLINVVAVNLSAQLVFLIRGVRPRTWLAQREAKQSTVLNLAIWAGLLLVCLYLVFIKQW
jgi:uncharacterized hydrophobic protein (TIGR00341 family)